MPLLTVKHKIRQQNISYSVLFLFVKRKGNSSERQSASRFRFYEGQDDLADILAVSICSVCYNTEKFVNFYILDCGICAFNKKLLESLKSKFNNFSLEFIPVDLTQFHHLTPWCEKFWDCYARLIIPELKPDVKKRSIWIRIFLRWMILASSGMSP